MPKQAFCPEGQAQVPAAQAEPPVQVRPHAVVPVVGPQLLLSVSGFTQVLPHATWPAEQLMAHDPARQIWPPGQTRPHTAIPIVTVPQLLLSVSGFTQLPEQFTCDSEQLMVQVPLVQICPPGQGRLHPPQ